MMHRQSLQRQFTFFLLLPVTLVFAGIGFLGFIYARDALLEEWREAAMLRLERAAHQLDMRLAHPLNLLQELPQGFAPGAPAGSSTWHLERLRRVAGVTGVSLAWREADGAFREQDPGRPLPALAARVQALSPPRFSYARGGETVVITADLTDGEGLQLGRVVVSLEAAALMQGILPFAWRAGHKACLVDESGQYLAHTDPEMHGLHHLGEGPDPLDQAVLAAIKTQPSGTILGPGHPPRLVTGFYRLHSVPWVILVYAHGPEILAPILRFRFYYFAAGAVFLVVIAWLIHRGTAPVAAAIRQISQAAAGIARGDYGHPLPVGRADEIGQLAQSFNAMVAGLKERDFIRDTFGRYMDPEVARELLKRPEASLLGGEKRQVAIMFADLRGFTPLAEGLTPEATILLLNRFFSAMVDLVQAYRGIIVDFLGDAILAFFDPLDHPLNQAVSRALACALAMQETMPEVNAWGAAHGLPTLHLGIGLHAGEVVVGNIGSASRAKYGIVGNAVNLTHRLQAEARAGQVALSQAAYDQLPDPAPVKAAMCCHLKGLQEPMTVYVVEPPARQPDRLES